MDKYQNKYRIPSSRLRGYDYGRNGAYFITICTQNRDCFFGKIFEDKMILNELGTLAKHFWLEIPDHFPFIELNNFVIMPNHTHGILIINKIGDGGDGVETRLIASLPTTTNTTTTDKSTQSNKPGGITGYYNPMFHENISRIIRWYKGRCSFEMRKIRADFAWQSRFHDHIIRNDAEYRRIENYIINNPQKWKEDKFNGQ